MSRCLLEVILLVFALGPSGEVYDLDLDDHSMRVVAAGSDTTNGRWREVVASRPDGTRGLWKPRLTITPFGELLITYVRVLAQSTTAIVTSDDGAYSWSFRLIPVSGVQQYAYLERESEVVGIVTVDIQTTTRLEFAFLEDLDSPILIESDPDRSPFFAELIEVPGHVVCAWLSDGDDDVEVRAAHSVSGGSSWSAPTTVVDNAWPLLDSGPVVLAPTTHGVLACAVDTNRVLTFSEFENGVWTPVGELAPDSTEVGFWFPAVARNPDGEIGVVFVRDDADVGLDLWFATSRDDGRTWSTPVLVSGNGPPGNHYDPKLAAGPDGSWHASWIYNIPFGFDIDTYYGTRGPHEADPWSTPERVNAIPGVVGPSAPNSTSIAVDPEGHVVIAWVEVDGNRTHIRVSTTRMSRIIPAGDPAGLELASFPSPFVDQTTLRVRFAELGQSADIVVTDVRGRLVRRWSNARARLYDATVIWDGRDGSGRSAAPGVYYWNARSGGRSSQERIVHLGAR